MSRSDDPELISLAVAAACRVEILTGPGRRSAHSADMTNRMARRDLGPSLSVNIWCAARGETQFRQYTDVEPIAFGSEDEDCLTDQAREAATVGLSGRSRDRLAVQRPVCINGAICQLLAMFGELVGRTENKLRLAHYAVNAAEFLREWLYGDDAELCKHDAAFADWLIRQLLAEPIVRLDTVCWWTLVLLAEETSLYRPLSPPRLATHQIEAAAVSVEAKSFANLFGWRPPADASRLWGGQTAPVPWSGIRRFEEAMPTGLARRLSGRSAIGDWCLEPAPFPGSPDPDRPFVKSARAF